VEIFSLRREFLLKVLIPLQEAKLMLFLLLNSRIIWWLGIAIIKRCWCSRLAATFKRNLTCRNVIMSRLKSLRSSRYNSVEYGLKEADTHLLAFLRQLVIYRRYTSISHQRLPTPLIVIC
jgi:hypothetical protein